MPRCSRVKQLFPLALLLLLVLYAADYLSVRYRIPNHRDPYGAVQVEHYYAVPKKNGKTEFMLLEPETQVCVRSLFPHFGYSPCWYAGRKTEKRENL